MATKQPSNTAKIVISSVFVLIGFAVIAMTWGENDRQPNPTSFQADEVVAPKEEPKSKSVVQVDLNSADALDKKYELDAGTSCDVNADDYLKSVARYDYKWSEDHFRFSSYRARVVAPGVLTMISTDALLQNGFGAYVRVKIKCDYDTQNHKVVGFGIDEEPTPLERKAADALEKTAAEERLAAEEKTAADVKLAQPE